MPLKGGRWRGAQRMLAASPARTAQMVPARPPSPQEKAGIRREQKTHTRFLYNVFDDSITIYWGGRCVLRHRSSRPPTHTLTSLSLTDPLHMLPLTTMLSPCRVFRCLSATSKMLEHFVLVPAQRACEQHARGE